MSRLLQHIGYQSGIGFPTLDEAPMTDGHASGAPLFCGRPVANDSRTVPSRGERRAVRFQKPNLSRVPEPPNGRSNRNNRSEF